MLADVVLRQPQRGVEPVDAPISAAGISVRANAGLAP
jgi:hypothetical protein